jgi:uncharacterized FAD-dependent dehydrogenase
LLIGGIRVSPDATPEQITEKAAYQMKRAGLPLSSLHFRLYKRSVDARRRDDVRLVCTVLAEGDVPKKCLDRLTRLPDVKLLEKQELDIKKGSERLLARPLVVGMGPAGLFCALLLAENGYAPILIDRGDCVADRARAVERFFADGVLDTDSNIQFGAGGAGTFSDGKLLTRINDARCSYVLERLHEFGAPDEILTRAKPHVGTDVLREVVDRMLDRIVQCGGEIHYRTCLQGLDEHADGTLTAHTTKGDFVCSSIVLAIGNAARDTYRYLIDRQFVIEPKPISVGVRIEHLQADIDRAMYGDFAGHPNLGPAEYALSDTKGERGVYTFCMCPGGEVVAAASEHGGLVVNGMSHHARDGVNANCAVAVSVRVSDYDAVEGNLALGAISYQRRIEQASYVAGGGDFVAPVQTVGDFMTGKVMHEPSRIMPSYRGGTNVRVTDLSQVFPSYVTESLRYGLASFDRKLAGFACHDAVLSAAETRTSAPVRMLRGEDGRAVGHASVYPCGEGAGYAGGITSAAVDGLKTAMHIMARFSPME